MSETVVDPRVSRMKFDREIDLYRQLDKDYIRRGWWLVRAEFPVVWVNFASNKQAPLPPFVAFGALMDFTNYDLWPPSVTLIRPFTGAPYKMHELPTPLPRRLPQPVPTGPDQLANPTGPTNASQGPAPKPPQFQNIMAALAVNAVPFACLPGVREYHTNPAHTGHSWFLHRRSSAGTLNYLLEQLYKYGVQPLRQGHHVQVQLVHSAEDIAE